MGSLTTIKKVLIKWYSTNKRDLPWRENKHAYNIWVSEIILQQTQVVQGLNYYLRFIERFPTVATLANADEQDILKLWQGLGYYSRARNMHFAAQQVMNDFNANFPTTYADLLALKGVGTYTASAIASIAYNLPYAVLDGNVMRVLSRLFLISEPINSTPGLKILHKLAEELLDKNNPGDFNQAMMEFGALQCVPKNPNCHSCPLNNVCLAFKEEKTDILPIKKQKTKQRHRYFLYLVHYQNNKLWITKRGRKDIWQGLFEFPLHESNKPFGDNDILKICKTSSKTAHIKSLSKVYKHVLSHQIIHARFVVLGEPKTLGSCIKINANNLSDYPVSRLTEKFLDNLEL